ncbi:MAG: hypothetical protein QGG48_03330 [Desulfatiglandales bacterium]|nr:hypothetical protein [Desulfatiglandales bacterium]
MGFFIVDVNLLFLEAGTAAGDYLGRGVDLEHVLKGDCLPLVPAAERLYGRFEDSIDHHPLDLPFVLDGDGHELGFKATPDKVGQKRPRSTPPPR